MEKIRIPVFLTKASLKNPPLYLILRVGDVPREICASTAPRDHQEFGEAIVGEPDRISGRPVLPLTGKLMPAVPGN